MMGTVLFDECLRNGFYLIFWAFGLVFGDTLEDGKT